MFWILLTLNFVFFNIGFTCQTAVFMGRLRHVYGKSTYSYPLWLLRAITICAFLGTGYLWVITPILNDEMVESDGDYFGLNSDVAGKYLSIYGMCCVASM